MGKTKSVEGIGIKGVVAVREFRFGGNGAVRRVMLQGSTDLQVCKGVLDLTVRMRRGGRSTVSNELVAAVGEEAVDLGLDDPNADGEEHDEKEVEAVAME